MSRPIIFLLLLVASIVMPKEALSQENPGAAAARAASAGRLGARSAPAPAKKNSKAEKRKKDSMAEGSGKKMDEPTAGGSTSKEPPSTPFTTKPLTLMAVLDIDGDGKLSGSEIDYATDQLLRLDVNDDGSIGEDELPGVMEPKKMVKAGFDPSYSGPGEQVYKTISGFDKNGDGMLTRSEIKADYRSVFRTMDTDGDRSISPQELLGYVNDQ